MTKLNQCVSYLYDLIATTFDYEPIRWYLSFGTISIGVLLLYVSYITLPVFV